MKLLKFGAVAFIVLTTLAGARCGGGATSANTPAITDVAVSVGIKYTNEPETVLETVASSSRIIYVSAEVTNPTKSTEVKVAWYKLPNQPIATETFSGKRGSSGNQLDFDYKRTTSWLASQVERPGLSWTIGEYRVEVYLDGQSAKTVFFNVVSDSDADKLTASKAIQSVLFSDAIDDNNQLVDSARTTFARSTPTLYIQVKLGAVPAGTSVEAGVRYVKTGLSINTFTAVATGNDTLLFPLPLERFGRLWSDKLWPIGSFQVITKINGVIGKTSTFLIEDQPRV